MSKAEYYGTDKDDLLIGSNSSDEIYAKDGDDIIRASDGNDLIDAGLGNDTMYGGLGDDTYVFGKDSGNDMIDERIYKYEARQESILDDDGIIRIKKVLHPYLINGGHDTLYFKDGIRQDDLNLYNDGKDLIVKLKNSEDSVRIKGYYDSQSSVEFFKFDDRTLYKQDEFAQFLFTNGADDISLEDTISRTIDAKDGDDIIRLSGGNNVVDGGRGNDTIYGGLGDDTYIFGKGSGNDIIIEKAGKLWWQDDSGFDKIALKQGIGKDDITINIENQDIVIFIKDSDDTLRIKNGVLVSSTIELVEFKNKEQISIKDMVTSLTDIYIEGDVVRSNKQILNLSKFTPNDIKFIKEDINLIFKTENDSIKVKDFFTGKSHLQTIIFKDGVVNLKGDLIVGNSPINFLKTKEINSIVFGSKGISNVSAHNGDDRLYGGGGWDTLVGGNGDDILNGGEGSDTLRGKLGDDIYCFKKGDGHDFIEDLALVESHQNGGYDRIKFDESVKKEDISFQNIAGMLSIKYGQSDTVSIFGQNNFSRSIERIELANNEFITSAQINKIIQDVNSYAKENGIINLSHDNMRNNIPIMQIVMSGWGA